METITNLANTAVGTASKLIYGDQTTKTEDKTADAVETTKNNETAGKEPVSGVEGKGTATQPFDQGNAPTPLAGAERSTFLDYETSKNETGGKEPVSGEQGKGTVTEPFDQGNDLKATEKATETATDKATETSSGSDDFLKLDMTTRGSSNNKLPDSQGEPKIYSDTNDPSYTGMNIVPLNPDANISSSVPKTASSTEATGITDKAGVTDQLWKDTPLDDISRSGAPGAGPRAPEHVTPATPDTTKTTTTSTDSAVNTSTHNSMTPSAGTYESSAPKVSGADAAENTKVDSAKASANRDTPGWASTGVTSDSSKFDPSTTSTTSMGEPKSIAGETADRKSETHKSPELASSPSNDEHSSKMSHLKEKMKNKLHIGSKDK